MKKEARILVSKCKNSICSGIILRFYSIDGLILSTNGCKDFCDKIKKSGYFYELSYYYGDCSCGLDKKVEVNKKYLSFLSNLIDEFEQIYKNAGGGV